jgi:phage shock protein C
MGNKLYRLPNPDGMIGGVCAGLAETWNMDVTILRIVFLTLGFLTSFPAILLYIILWIAMPLK